MRRHIVRLAVAIGAATGLLGLLSSAAFAAGDTAGRIGTNHSEPER